VCPHPFLDLPCLADFFDEWISLKKFLHSPQKQEMRYFLSFLLLLLGFVTKAQDSVHVDFPNYVIEGVQTKLTVRFDGLPQAFVLGKDQKKYPVLENDEGFYVEHAFYRGKQGALEKFGKAPAIIPSWWAVIPPIVAIVFALLVKEVLIALLMGIFIGAATLGFYTNGISGIFSGFLAVLDHYILHALSDADHLAVILFSLLIGAIVAVISKNGGMKGVVNRIVKYAQTRRSGMFATYFLGIAIFFDDYANTLVVGNTMRPVTDKLKISRQKLAYIVDSTAAPVSAIAFVTTWIGAELGYISSAMDKINENGVVVSEGVYSIFVNSLAYSFYPILTLVFMFMLIRSQRDYGPMLKAEKQALNANNEDIESNTEDLNYDEFTPENDSKNRAFNAIIPVLIIVIGTLVGLVYTGMQSWRAEFVDLGLPADISFFQGLAKADESSVTTIQKIGSIIGAANSYSALLWSSMLGLTVAILLTISQGIMSLNKAMETAVQGIKTMIPAIAILVLAWALAEITRDLNTADVIKNAFGTNFGAWLIPAITFVISALIAFSTGSSWSTMAIVYPIMIPTAFAIASAGEGIDSMAILYNTVASVLAGAVLGDHCSPISDTTILSSLATSCDHVEHVKTQIPYALTVGGVALFGGILPTALGISPWIAFSACLLVLYLIVRFAGKKAA
jgi:Na+/H+ antiporter NhaC